MSDVDLLTEAGEEAVDEFVDLLVEVMEESMGPDGEVPGMVPMTPGDRISDTAWMAQTGALDALKVISPKRYEQRVRQMLEDMKHSPFTAGTYEE